MRMLKMILQWIVRNARPLRRLHAMAMYIDLIILLENVAILLPEIEARLSPHHSAVVAVLTDQQQRAPGARIAATQLVR